MKEKQPDPIKTFRAQWAVMTFYERFEQVIALALSAIIAVIIVVSLLQLISIVFSLLVIDAFNPLDHKVFQTVFGMIMTLLIAMEFKHSIVRVALRRDSIIQVKTVILIGLIALARKFVILDPETSPAKIERESRAWLLPGWGNPEPSWLRTHPATTERIQRLRELADSMAPQPLHSSPFLPDIPLAPRPPRWRASGVWR